MQDKATVGESSPSGSPKACLECTGPLFGWGRSSGVKSSLMPKSHGTAREGQRVFIFLNKCLKRNQLVKALSPFHYSSPWRPEVLWGIGFPCAGPSKSCLLQRICQPLLLLHDLLTCLRSGILFPSKASPALPAASSWFSVFLFIFQLLGHIHSAQDLTPGVLGGFYSAED